MLRAVLWGNGVFYHALVRLFEKNAWLSHFGCCLSCFSKPLIFCKLNKICGLQMNHKNKKICIENNSHDNKSFTNTFTSLKPKENPRRDHRKCSLRPNWAKGMLLLWGKILCWEVKITHPQLPCISKLGNWNYSRIYKVTSFQRFLWSQATWNWRKQENNRSRSLVEL